MQVGFGADGYRFLEELGLNNSRDWFTSHKTEYETFVKKPSEGLSRELVDLVSREFGKEFGVKIYRIHRDIRFSKDKTPYNPYVRMTLMPVAEELEGKICDRPAFHFSIEPNEVIAGCGMFGFEGDMLAKYRSVVDSDAGKELAKILEDLKTKGGRIDEPELKRVPSEFDSNHVREDLLRRKGLALWFHEGSIHEAGNAIYADDILKMFKQNRPLLDWMNAYV